VRNIKKRYIVLLLFVLIISTVNNVKACSDCLNSIFLESHSCKLLVSNNASLEELEADSIEIDSDCDFIEYGFQGEGTEEDPYKIENKYIKVHYIDDIAISISYTTKFFTIRN